GSSAYALGLPNTHALYLLDLGREIRQYGETAKADVGSVTDRPKSDPNRTFLEGRRMAYVEVLSLMQQQAVAFDLPLRDLGLEGFDAERDLL
ncbi:MAG TPA: hypothetical protein VGO19_10395, partial [Actinomycetes bacterium]